ncbi:ParB/RepB/Spo0J family partition protein [Nocardioides donggukensis]|uniref:ParB/RepB/Spo0J family partition protein n=1 Tax=Nocardioides donggukensis TaxID=2774019 RepID=A0A927Q343_9ACTN|nr:ParB/RepB/Spo0J family partition protein [Nocardioides donggukensis]MBD8870989.1 ParB/RepB/Spo0J family partition protein [Nocardioides donggukensis]
MNQRQPQRRGLGRGLGALIPTAPPEDASASTREGDQPSGSFAADGRPRGDASSAPRSGSGMGSTVDDGGHGGAPESGGRELEPVAGAYFAEVPLSAITPNPRQPRQVFEEEAMGELVHSIREVGLLQPVVVRRTGEHAYELIMGERRWRAAQQAGLTEIPAIVRQTDDVDMLRDALLENLHRSQLNPLEEAAAYSQMLEDFGCTHDELAQRIGRSRPQISNTLRLLRLSPAVQRRVAAGVLSAGHARSLLAVDDGERQDKLAQRVVAEGISVRGLEEIVAVGEEGSAPRVTRRKPTAPGLTDLSDRLSDRFETRVKVDLGKSKGKITVEFASMDDLQRIVEIMDPRNRRDRPI